jgi:hypothetical protein
MPGTLFTQNTIAVIWDFDKTLSPGNMQAPLFAHYGVNEEEFWDEVNQLEHFYLSHGSRRVSKDTVYLHHILTYVQRGIFKGLNNRVLRELGAKIQLYDGLPEFLNLSKQSVAEDPDFKVHGITVEHYIVSTGLYEMIMGSPIAPFINDVWGCEFVEFVAEPGYLKPGQQSLLLSPDVHTILDTGYTIDNTSKTRAIFEINKGTNKLSKIGVNDTIDREDRRVPFQNMIYIADGPSDVPSFSVINQYGGTTFSVYQSQNKKQFEQVVDLQLKKRVQGIGEANYVDGSFSSMWILNAIERIAKRIVSSRESLLKSKVGQAPQHVSSELKGKEASLGSTEEVGKAAVENEEESQGAESSLVLNKKGPSTERQGGASRRAEAGGENERNPGH